MKNFCKSGMLLIVIAVLISCTERKKAEKPILVDVDAAGIRQVIEEHKGTKPVLLNVWATWCAPCIEEFPYLLKLEEGYGDEFTLLLVNADFPEAKPEALEFLEKQKVNFKSYYKTGKDNDFILAVSEEWTGALPFTLVVDKRGEIIAQWEGKADFETFESELLRAISN